MSECIWKEKDGKCLLHSKSASGGQKKLVNYCVDGPCADEETEALVSLRDESDNIPPTTSGVTTPLKIGRWVVDAKSSNGKFSNCSECGLTVLTEVARTLHSCSSCNAIMSNCEIPTPLRNLNLSTRAYNCLKRADINTVEQLSEKTDDELLRIRGMGIFTLQEIQRKLRRFNESTPAETELISRNALLSVLEAWETNHARDRDGTTRPVPTNTREMIELISEQPTIAVTKTTSQKPEALDL